MVVLKRQFSPIEGALAGPERTEEALVGPKRTEKALVRLKVVALPQARAGGSRRIVPFAFNHGVPHPKLRSLVTVVVIFFTN